MDTTIAPSFLKLVKIMDELREQCPWDKKQTIATLRQMTIEETYELADAVTAEDWKGIKEELGDLLLHILFYTKIASEQKQFQLTDVMNGIADKLISRHPHIYPAPDSEGKLVKVNDEEDVKQNWEKLKLKEGKKSVLSGVPVSLPSVVKAMRLQEKAKQVGFEWENKVQVWEKVEEEIGELKAAEQSGNIKHTEEEMGDLLFSLINYARFLQVDADQALESTNKKFISRFTALEAAILQQGKDISKMTLQEMDAIWDGIKKQQKV